MAITTLTLAKLQIKQWWQQLRNLFGKKTLGPATKQAEAYTPRPNKLGYNVWFTSDNHIHHKNILKHCPLRAKAGGFDIDDVEAHDRWVLKTWNKTVAKKDIVYIIGDFTFMTPEWAKRYLSKMNGRKFLILGNHDKSVDHLHNYFEQIVQMKEVVFKKSNYEFLDEDFRCFLCHYNMTVWPSKHYGVVQVHGHSHGRLDDFNDALPDLRVDVGWDSRLAQFNLVHLEQLYNHFKKKTGGLPFSKYASKMKKERKTPI